MSSFFSSTDVDPFQFSCDNCGASKLFTESEIEDVKQKTPGSDDDFFILCLDCRKGHMTPPSFISIFDDF